MSMLPRLALSAAAAIGAALVAAIALALVELYLSGHGYGSITREVIIWDPGGVHLSLADLVALFIAFAAAAATWRVQRR